LKKKYPEDYAALNDPATTDEFRQLKNYYSISTLPDGFEELYQLHNGQNEDVSARLFYGLEFLPLSYAIGTHQGMIASYIDMLQFSNWTLVEEEIEKSDKSPMSKIPIGGGSDLYILAVDISPSSKGVFGQVVFMDIESEIAIKVSDSITNMVCGKYDLYSKSGQLHPTRELDLANWYHNNMQ